MAEPIVLVPTEDHTNPPAAVQDTPKVKKQRAVTRTLEELDGSTIKGMSELELRKYADYLREQVSEREVRVANFETAAKSSFDKAKYFEDQYKTLVRDQQAVLQFIKQAAGTFYSSLLMAVDTARTGA